MALYCQSPIFARHGIMLDRAVLVDCMGTTVVVQVSRTVMNWVRAFFGSGGKHRGPDLRRSLACRSEFAQCELTFPDPMHELDPGDRDRRAPKSLEPEHSVQSKPWTAPALQEPGQPALRGDRREGRRLPRTPTGGQVAYVWLDTADVKVRKNGRIVSAAISRLCRFCHGDEKCHTLTLHSLVFSRVRHLNFPRYFQQAGPFRNMRGPFSVLICALGAAVLLLAGSPVLGFKATAGLSAHSAHCVHVREQSSSDVPFPAQDDREGSACPLCSIECGQSLFVDSAPIEFALARAAPGRVSLVWRINRLARPSDRDARRARASPFLS